MGEVRDIAVELAEVLGMGAPKAGSAPGGAGDDDADGAGVSLPPPIEAGGAEDFPSGTDHRNSNRDDDS